MLDHVGLHRWESNTSTVVGCTVGGVKRPLVARCAGGVVAVVSVGRRGGVVVVEVGMVLG